MESTPSFPSEPHRPAAGPGYPQAAPPQHSMPQHSMPQPAAQADYAAAHAAPPAAHAAPPGPPAAQPLAAPPARPGVSPQELQWANIFWTRVQQEVRKVYVGQEELVRGTLVALVSGGHVLIESVPGLGKTLFVRTLGRVLGCKFGRIQFTADLMPSDVTGAPVFDMKTQEFRFRPGPVFTQFLLADEINRSPAKTHAALLEIMQEYRVTIDGAVHPLERPFLVMATQNPIESEGTYSLPEAQLDRFMFKIRVPYPGEEEEAKVLRLHAEDADLYGQLQEVQPICTAEQILQVGKLCSRVAASDRILQYINQLVRKTRAWPNIFMGASPRASISLLQGARALALFSGRDYVVPDDVITLWLPALRHRVILSPEAEVEGREVDDVLRELARSIEVPRL